MPLTQKALLVLVGLCGSEGLSIKERVIVGTSAILNLRQLGGLCQTRGDSRATKKKVSFTPLFTCLF